MQVERMQCTVFRRKIKINEPILLTHPVRKRSLDSHIYLTHVCQLSRSCAFLLTLQCVPPSVLSTHRPTCPTSRSTPTSHPSLRPLQLGAAARGFAAAVSCYDVKTLAPPLSSSPALAMPSSVFGPTLHQQPSSLWLGCFPLHLLLLSLLLSNHHATAEAAVAPPTWAPHRRKKILSLVGKEKEKLNIPHTTINTAAYSAGRCADTWLAFWLSPHLGQNWIGGTGGCTASLWNFRLTARLHGRKTSMKSFHEKTSVKQNKILHFWHRWPLGSNFKIKALPLYIHIYIYHREKPVLFFVLFFKLHLQKFALTVTLHVQVILLTTQKTQQWACRAVLTQSLPPCYIGHFNIQKENWGKLGKGKKKKVCIFLYCLDFIATTQLCQMMHEVLEVLKDPVVNIGELRLEWDGTFEEGTAAAAALSDPGQTFAGSHHNPQEALMLSICSLLVKKKKKRQVVMPHSGSVSTTTEKKN